MSPHYRRVLTPLLVAGLAGCGGAASRSAPLPQGVVEAEQERQRELALADLEHHQRRLDSIAYPLLARSTALCPGAVGYRLGMRVATVHDYEEPWRNAAAGALRLGDTLAVLGLVRDGPAGEAGLRPGDRLLQVSGRDLPAGARAPAAFGEALAAARKAGGNRVSIRYARNGDTGEAAVVLAPGCDYGTHVLIGGELNAYADGRDIFVTSTMMRFTDDDELRVVVAHELAHNARGHIGNRQQSAMLRVPAPAGVTIGGYRTSNEARSAAPSFPVESEREADYLALYALALAGVALDPAPRFWRHVAQADPEGIGIAATHPTPAERFVRMEQTIAEIERKRAAGLPLTPEPLPVAAAAPTNTATPAPRHPAPASRSRPQSPASDSAARGAPPAARVRSASQLQLDQGLRETLRDVTRLRIAEAYEEVEPGLLVVALSPDAFSQSSAEYNLKRLYLAYDRATLWPEDVTLELWHRGRAIGRYTRDGLLLEPQPPADAPAE
ncbi:MAG TPA: M48 family metallopeptidase [Gemmatimonadales bacterium]